MSSREAFCLPSPISNSELHCRPFQHTSTLPVRDRHHPCITRPLVLAPVQCDAEKTVILGLLAPDSIYGLQPLATSRGNGHRYLCSLSFLPFFFSFLLHCTACGILVPWSRIKPTLPALVQSLNHWTTREVQPLFYFLSFKASQSQKVQPPKLRENHAYPSCAVRLWIKNKLLHLSSWHAFQLHMTFKYSTAQQNSPDGGKVAIEHRVM